MQKHDRNASAPMSVGRYDKISCLRAIDGEWSRGDFRTTINREVGERCTDTHIIIPSLQQER